jgi:folate-dependent phosphoribosylglycinamide formyltransferase PurN
MKITILLRYPRLESSAWKIELINKLIEKKFEISIVYGDKSLFRQARAVFKEFGFEIIRKKKAVEKSGGRNVYKYFSKKLPVFKVGDLNSSECEKVIRSINPDYILLLGTGIMRKNILTIPPLGAVHCHHGYLPDFRGVSTAEWSLFYKNEVYISTHFVDPGIDTGDILLRRKVPLEKTDNIQSLRYKCRIHSIDLIVDTFEKLRNNELQRIKQTKNEGKQFYFMHPFFKGLIEQKFRIAGK